MCLVVEAQIKHWKAHLLEDSTIYIIGICLAGASLVISYKDSIVAKQNSIIHIQTTKYNNFMFE